MALDAMNAGSAKAQTVDIKQHMAMSPDVGYLWLQQQTVGLDAFQTSRWVGGFYATLSRRIYSLLLERGY